MNYYIITYGCQMNKSDSERIAAFLESKGYKAAPKESRADLIVVNMCSVRQSAVDRVFGLSQKLAKLKTQNSKLKTILTGCILKTDKKKFREKFNEIWGVKENKSSSSPLATARVNKDYINIGPKGKNSSLAYVPISIGCNNFCSYCVVPFARGREICRPPRDIISEVKTALKNNCKEIWLLGQNVNSYQYKKYSEEIIKFAELLRMVNNISGRFWIRFTSPNPKDFSDDLIKAMVKCEKATPYLNLPLQSGDNEILKRMKRSYTAQQYEKLVKKIRKKIPGITLSTDVIVGFPGETKSQFENTKKLFTQIKFDMAYIAQYSERPGTLASKMSDDVSKEEKEKREKILTEILKKNAFEINKKYIGKIIEVLPIEEKSGYLIGKSFEYKTVKFKGLKTKVGEFCPVKIKNALAWGLEGEIVEK